MVKRAVLAALLWGRLAQAQTTPGKAEAKVNAPVLVDRDPAERPITKRPLFWLTVIGGAAVIAAGIGLAIGLNPPHDPTATWGVGVGN